MRCSGARVFRTPSHVKAKRTAAMVVRSLLAALGVVWVTGVLVGWVVVRLVVCWPVVGSVVLAVDIGTCDLLGELVGRAGRQDCWQTGGGTAWKTPWLVTVLEAYGGRLAIEATREPSASKSGSGIWESLDDGLGRRRYAAQPPDPHRQSHPLGNGFGRAIDRANLFHSFLPFHTFH